MIANSLKTFNLNPEHNYVPWVVIDKNHTAEMQRKAESHLLKFLCDSYFNHVSLASKSKTIAANSFVLRRILKFRSAKQKPFKFKVSRQAEVG